MSMFVIDIMKCFILSQSSVRLAYDTAWAVSGYVAQYKNILGY